MGHGGDPRHVVGVAARRTAPYEELLDEPLAAVRAHLGTRPDGEAHPRGHIYSHYQFGRSDQRQMTHAYQPHRCLPDGSDSAAEGDR